MTVVGTIELIAKIDTSAYKKGANEIDKENDKLENSTEKSSKGMSKSLGTAAKVGFGVLITAAVTAGAAIVSNLDNAVRRIDTLNNSTRTFANLGFSADTVKKAMDGLERSIKGLPTSLDAGVRGVQQLASSTGDLLKSQEIFSAINNAIIGFGGNAESVEGAIRQLSQAFAGGKIDAETYNSLLDNGLGPVLNAIAKQMGITAGELKKGLSEGRISVEEFQDSLVSLNKNGGGGIVSLEQIAKDSTSGIQTSFDNMNTAITRGITKVIETIGADNIAKTITGIGKFFEDSSKLVVDGVKIMQTALGILFDLFGPLINQLKENTQLIEVLKVAFVAIAAIIGGVVLGLIAGTIVIFAALGYAITEVIKFVQNLMQGFIIAANVIQSAFSGMYNFFKGLWNNIVSLFGSVGTVIGNAVAGAFKSIVNQVLRFAANTINGFIDAINAAIGIVNNIPGVKIGKLGRLPIPQLAEGGIVSSPTLAMIGEGRESEAVIPLSKLDKMISGDGGSNVNVTLNLSGVMTSSKADERAVALRFGKLLNEALKSKGAPQIEGIS